VIESDISEYLLCFAFRYPKDDGGLRISTWLEKIF
jgi:hypothetical protein